MAEDAAADEMLWIGQLRKDPRALADFLAYLQTERQRSLEKCALGNDADARAEVRILDHMMATLVAIERDEAQLVDYRTANGITVGH